MVNYTHQVSEEWHWHDRTHISAILRGGNLESRTYHETQVTPGKIMTYEMGEIHRNRYTAHPSTNLNVELAMSFFQNDLNFQFFKTDDQAYLSLLKIYFELSLGDKHSLKSINQILETLFWKESKSSKCDWILRLEAILQDRWDEFVPLEELAAELSVHPITISKYFTKHKGFTLTDYMRRLKVNKASTLLMGSKKSLAEVAYSCGFSDQSHMTRVMKSYLGFTPNSLRKAAKG